MLVWAVHLLRGPRHSVGNQKIKEPWGVNECAQMSLGSSEIYFACW